MMHVTMCKVRIICKLFVFNVRMPSFGVDYNFFMRDNIAKYIRINLIAIKY